MDNLITGLLGVALIVLFLGFYAVKLNSIPLWLIIASVLAMIIYHFYETLKEGNQRD